MNNKNNTLVPGARGLTGDIHVCRVRAKCQPPEITKVTFHLNIPLKVHWTFPVETHWESDSPLGNVTEQ